MRPFYNDRNILTVGRVRGIFTPLNKDCITMRRNLPQTTLVATYCKVVGEDLRIYFECRITCEKKKILRNCCWILILLTLNCYFCTTMVMGLTGKAVKKQARLTVIFHPQITPIQLSERMPVPNPSGCEHALLLGDSDGRVKAIFYC